MTSDVDAHAYGRAWSIWGALDTACEDDKKDPRDTTLTSHRRHNERMREGVQRCLAGSMRYWRVGGRVPMPSAPQPKRHRRSYGHEDGGVRGGWRGVEREVERGRKRSWRGVAEGGRGGGLEETQTETETDKQRQED